MMYRIKWMVQQSKRNAIKLNFQKKSRIRFMNELI